MAGHERKLMDPGVAELPADQVHALLRHFAQIDDASVRWSFIELLRAFSSDPELSWCLSRAHQLN